MNHLKENFILIREDLALTDAERFAMRSQLERQSAPRSGAVLSPFLFFSSGSLRFAGAFAVLLIAALGGSSALAAGALPGDTLYSVKIHVNESVERTLAPTPLAKAEVDIKHAEERLSEVELLAAKGDTDTEDIAAAAAAVAANVASASDTAHDLASSGDEAKADAISARISSALMAHADILDAQAGSLDDADSGQSLRALSFAVSATADLADVSQEQDASTTEESPAAVKEVALAREAQAEDLIGKLAKSLDEDGVPAETHDVLLGELAAIQTDSGAALDLIASEDYENASASYEKLQQRAYRSLALLRSARRINEATGKDVVVTLEDSTSSGRERSALMKAAATLAAPTALTSEEASGTAEIATDTPVLKKGNDVGTTLKFRVRARSWNP